MTLNRADQFGVGTTTPLAGYRLDINGPVRSFGDTTHFVAHDNWRHKLVGKILHAIDKPQLVHGNVTEFQRRSTIFRR